MADELDRRFKKAVWLIRNGPKKNSSNDTKLMFYSYFKQATEGDVQVRIFLMDLAPLHALARETSERTL